MRKVIREYIDDEGKVDSDLLVGRWLGQWGSTARIFWNQADNSEIIVFDNEVASDVPLD